MRGAVAPLASELLEPAASLPSYATVEDASRLLGCHDACFLLADERWWDVVPRDLVGVPHTRRLIEVELRPAEPLLASAMVSEATFSGVCHRPVFDDFGVLAGQVTYRGLLDYHRITDELANVRLAVRSLVHDFNNVLLLGQSAADDGDIERSRQALVEIEGLARRLATLGGRDDDAPFPFQLDAFLKDAANQFATLTRLDVEATVEDARTIRSKPGVLRRVLLNLCLNAKQVGAKRVRFETSSEGSSLVLRVVDDGPGFSVEGVRRGFEIGYSTSGGAGLGLPTVHRLVVTLGGAVRLLSMRGQGIVELVFPWSVSDARWTNRRSDGPA